LKSTSSQEVVVRNTEALIEIGELASRTGTAASAIRYYEKLGLMSPDERRGGRRRYSEPAAERVALIRLCQDVGFSLGEIGEILNVTNRSSGAWTRAAELKIHELDDRIAAAMKAKELLEHARDCPHPNLLACPHFRDELGARLVRYAAGGGQNARPVARPAGRVERLGLKQ
jgi:DNA-binding transcriptional MerR regulator